MILFFCAFDFFFGFFCCFLKQTKYAYKHGRDAILPVLFVGFAIFRVALCFV